MILRIILKNFLSFDNEVQFDMFPNMKRTHLNHHIYTQFGEVPVFKERKRGVWKGISIVTERFQYCRGCFDSPDVTSPIKGKVGCS